MRSIICPVATLVMLTLAPMITAPEGSLTVPTMLPVLTVVWASIGRARIDSDKTVQNVEPLFQRPDFQALLAEFSTSTTRFEDAEADGRGRCRGIFHGNGTPTVL